MNDDFEKKTAAEQLGLLPNRYYLVLEPLEEDSDDVGEGESGFTMRAYSTVQEPLEGAITDNAGATLLVLHGLIRSLEADFDYVFEAGAERIKEEYEAGLDNIDADHIKSVGTVIHVDFTQERH